MKELNKVIEMNPSEFAEKYLNIKLSNYQKQLLDKIGSRKYFIKINYPRGYSFERRIIQYYNACVYFSKMKDDDVVIVAKSDGCKQMNKKEFGDFLCNDFWR